MKIPALMLVAAVSLFAAGDYSNRRAPGFSLMDSQYRQHDPQDYRGKVLLIDFMLTTCPVCNSLADTLVQVQSKYGDKVAVLSIVALPDNFQTVADFVAGHKIPWPVLFDSGQVMISYLRLTPGNMNMHFPHLFLVDGNGAIRDDFDGTEDRALTAAGLAAEIDKLLQ